MSPRLRTTLYGTVAALAIGAGVLQFQAAPTNFIAPAHAQNTQAAALPSFADVVERVRPAVVSVRVSRAATSEQMSFREIPGLEDGDGGMMERFMRRFGEGQRGERGERFGRGPQRGGPRAMAQGSGFFISADGYVVTNNHVVEGASEADLVIDGGRTVKAKVVGTDPRTDLALLKVDGSNFPFVRFAGQAPRVGDWVLAVGNPFGLGGTVTAGIVSARGRDIGAGPYDDFLQIDAPINKGNSGGPTFNVNGEVVGMNTAIASPSGGSVGLAFAIPAETVQAVVDQLRTDGKVARGYLGVQIQPVTQDIAEGLGLDKAKGALVDHAENGTPAAKAGLKAGDVIEKVNGDTVDSARELSRKIAGLKPGAKVELSYLRGGKTDTATVTLGTMPTDGTKMASRDDDSGNGQPRLGLQLAPAGDVGLSDQGVAVVQVDPDGPAAAKGIEAGDVILDVGGQSVSRPADVATQIRAAETSGRKAVLMRVKSGKGQTRFVAVSLNKKAG